MKLRPLADRVLLRPTEAEETTKSGIILSTANKEKPVRRQDFLVSRDCTQDHPGPSLTPCRTEKISALTPGRRRKPLG